MRFDVRQQQARGILSKTSGFIAEAGFTHSLTPARNCTFGCVYCYVPTMRIYAGLKPDDWRQWGRFTTLKTNAADLLARQLRAGQVIYCSPLVDPYQPAEQEAALMPGILDALLARPPRVFVLQTRSSLLLRDHDRLLELNRRTRLRVSFSVTTDRDDVRRAYEPHCEAIERRFEVIRSLREAGIRVHATLAPLLPCNPEKLAEMALDATDGDVIGDPLHTRAVKRHGATTREEALRLSNRRGWSRWHDPDYQQQVAGRIRLRIEAAGRRFATGPAAFGWLAEP